MARCGQFFPPQFIWSPLTQALTTAAAIADNSVTSAYVEYLIFFVFFSCIAA